MRHPRLLVAVLMVLAGVTAPAAILVSAQSPPGKITLAMAGLAQPVEIVRDRWGVNHIYAKTESDLFFAQGYAAAQDRLFQFEVWRRQATGTVAEMLGPHELKRDIGARLHMFRGDLDAELNHYHPRGKQIIEAYVAGVNARIAETERDAALLPLEFRLLGIKPGRWTPAVVVSRHQALTANIADEVRYVRTIKAIGQEKLRELLYFQGGEPVLTLDPAIDAQTFPDGVLDLYTTFRSSVVFRPEDITPAYRAPAAAVAAHPAPSNASNPANLVNPANQQNQQNQQNPQNLENLLHLSNPDIGSNNWVVSGSRTQSAFPILANDPHRVIAAPSLRYWVHLVAPGWDVIGGGEPVLPGVSIGHNQHGAWGLTIFGNDSEDLYVYDTNPANPNEYRYRGSWEPMRVIADTIAVKGGAPSAVELKFTRHGPVVFEDKARHRAYAVRAAWMEAGGAPYLASLRMDQATTWEEFREACRFNRMPAENMIWADRRGTIGYQAAGIQPLRRNWSGMLPVPGDGRYEWDGYFPITALPHETNPARGFVATANNYLFPNDYPYPEAMHFTWADPYRSSRITEVLGSGRLFSVAEMVRLQNDNLSLPARALVQLLRDVPLPNAASASARDVLLRWDFALDQDSVPAGIYAMWQRHVLTNARDLLVPASVRSVAGTLLSTKRIIDTLHAPDGRFGAQPLDGRDQLLVRSLDQAVADLTKRFGADMQGWRYGQERYHHALIQHPLANAVNGDTRARLNVGPLPRGGDGSTVSATGNADNQTAGGSFKMIADTEDWDNSVGLNTPGQAGDPADPHYRDLFELWARGRYFTLAYSRAKVLSVAERVTILEPARTSTQQ